MNVNRTLPASAARAINAATARRNAILLPAGTPVVDMSTGARGRVRAAVAETGTLIVALDNGATVYRRPAGVKEINADVAVGNGRLPRSIDIEA